MDWSLCRVFLAVLRQGSLSGAARTLGVAQPTARRQLDALEAALGAALFVRSPDGLTPTEAAVNLRQAAEAMESAAALFERAGRADAHAPRGAVRLTASDVMGVEIVPALLRPVLDANPDIEIDLAPTNRPLDMLGFEADIAIRLVTPTQGALVARRVGALKLGLYARAEVAEALPTPLDLAALRDAGRLIGDDRRGDILRAVENLGAKMERRDFRVRTDSDLAQIAAIRAGLGVGVCPDAIAARDPSLIRVLPAIGLALPIYLVVHPDRRRNPAVALVYAALADGLTRL